MLDRAKDVICGEMLHDCFRPAGGLNTHIKQHISAVDEAAKQAKNQISDCESSSLFRSFVPKPVYAVLQLFPVSEPYEKERKARDEQAKHDTIPKDMMFFKQTVSMQASARPAAGVMRC